MWPTYPRPYVPFPILGVGERGRKQLEKKSHDPGLIFFFGGGVCLSPMTLTSTVLNTYIHTWDQSISQHYRRSGEEL